MWWWHGSGWGWFAMTILMFAFWALVIWAVVAVARGERRAASTTDAESVLGRRFAAGEIDEYEYGARLDILRGSRAAPTGRAGGPCS